MPSLFNVINDEDMGKELLLPGLALKQGALVVFCYDGVGIGILPHSAPLY